MQTKLNLFGFPILLNPFQPAFSSIATIFSFRTQLNTLVISFSLIFQMMKKLLVCGKISLVKLIACYIQLIACYIHSLAVALSDDEEIACVRKDLTRKANCMLHSANCMLHSFSCCSPCVKTKLFSSFCLSLYGSCLWSFSAPALRSLETIFNNILRKIWHLPRMFHTGILHQVAHLDSIFIVYLI